MAGRVKDAWWLVRELGLQAAFPDAEALYRRHTLRSLAARQRWAAATALCAGDVELQVRVRVMVLRPPRPWTGGSAGAATALCTSDAELQLCGGSLGREVEMAEQLHVQPGLPIALDKRY